MCVCERERERDLVNFEMRVSRLAERGSACDSPLAFDPEPSGARLSAYEHLRSDKWEG